MHATVMIQDGSIVKRSQWASRLEMDGDVIRHAKGPHAERPVYPEGAATLHEHDDGVRVEMRGEWAMVRVIPEPPEPEYNDDGEQTNEWPEFPDPVWPDVMETIAATRYEHETGGTTVDGMHVATDRQSQSMISGAFGSAKDAKETGEEFNLKWKAKNGWVNLDADQVIGMGRSVRQHVQACFDREKELTEAVEDGTFEESMLNEGWPE